MVTINKSVPVGTQTYPKPLANLEGMKSKQFSLTLLTFCVAAISGQQAAEAAALTKLATGLDNARGVSFGSDGAIYVTEAGTGGDGTCVSSPSQQGGELCYGTSGAVTKIQNGNQERVLTNLPSLAAPNGTEAAGPHDIGFDSKGDPKLLMGYAANPNLRDSQLDTPEQPKASDLGRLVDVDFENNSYTDIADFASYESRNNPDGNDLVSNPLSFSVQEDTTYVVDAGGNNLLSVDADGSNLNNEAVFEARTLENPTLPPREELPTPTSEVPEGSFSPEDLSLQSVPTGVAVDSDGSPYVSELTGFPFPEDKAQIYRVGADGEQVYADGFTQLVDVAFDKQNNLYALEHSVESLWKGNPAGALVKIAPDGTRTVVADGQDGLVYPTNVKLGPNGSVYVTNKGSIPGEGELVRVDSTTAVPEPSSTLGILTFGAFGAGSLLRRRRKLQS